MPVLDSWKHLLHTGIVWGLWIQSLINVGQMCKPKTTLTSSINLVTSTVKFSGDLKSLVFYVVKISMWSWVSHLTSLLTWTTISTCQEQIVHIWSQTIPRPASFSSSMHPSILTELLHQENRLPNSPRNFSKGSGSLRHNQEKGKDNCTLKTNSSGKQNTPIGWEMTVKQHLTNDEQVKVWSQVQIVRLELAPSPISIVWTPLGLHILDNDALISTTPMVILTIRCYKKTDTTTDCK